MKTNGSSIQLFLTCAAFLVLPAAVQAQFTFATNAGVITVTGYTGAGATVIIPTTTNGLTVKSIGTNAFEGLTNLAVVVIPGGVTNIGIDAFEDCTNLASVYFAGNAPAVGSAAFAGDSAATVYYVPTQTGWSSSFAGLRAIATTPANEFNYQTIGGGINISGYSGSGGNVVIPGTILGSTVTSIGSSAFENKTSFAPSRFPEQSPILAAQRFMAPAWSVSTFPSVSSASACLRSKVAPG